MFPRRLSGLSGRGCSAAPRSVPGSPFTGTFHSPYLYVKWDTNISSEVVVSLLPVL